MDRPAVLIITDEPEFSAAITRRWLAERNVPSFTLAESFNKQSLKDGKFDLALVGGVAAQQASQVFAALQASGKPVICVSRSTSPALSAEIVSVPEIQEWPDLVVTLATQIFERERTAQELLRLSEKNTQLEHQAALGRYVLDVRHSLNNALTSILGNSELMLLDSASLQPTQCTQLETIRNMAMRLNEIMHRFSSLQKEMQLIEQQGSKSKSVAAGTL